MVATDVVVGRAGFFDLASQLLAACGPGLALHLRLRASQGGAVYRLARPLAERAADSGGWCVLNGRVDVALAARAQAVQLGRGALRPAAARRVLGEGVAIGASVHAVDEVRRRAAEGADYALVGTVFPTASHPGRPGGGTGLVRTCADVGLPVVGIGGIDGGTVASVIEAGAAGIAVVRAVWGAADPVRSARQLLGVARSSLAARGVRD